ncbi:MAG: hypothetical protein JST16_15165 [Bdellovibrionales bacterium]|nr:hypothetical protein [Bdellovibrionales bacterium]
MLKLKSFMGANGWGRKFILGLLGVSCQLELAQASPSLIDSFSGRFDDFENFSSFGLCGLAPASAQLPYCSPDQLAQFRRTDFEMSGFLVATESTLDLTDAIRNRKLDASILDDVFKKYNYSDVLVATRASLAINHWLVGLVPFRRNGLFQVQNPSLPFASLVYREDLSLFVGYGYHWNLGDRLALDTGLRLNYLKRTQLIAEATVVDIVSKPGSEIFQKSSLAGVFADSAVSLRYGDEAVLHVQAWDLGSFQSGTDNSDQYLYVVRDRTPRLGWGAAWTPRVWAGRLQVGGELFQFLNYPNAFADQWVGTLSYFVGPLRVLSAVRPGLFRSGMGLRFGGYEVSVANEWINTIQTGRETQPRLILGVAAGL